MWLARNKSGILYVSWFVKPTYDKIHDLWYDKSGKTVFEICGLPTEDDMEVVFSNSPLEYKATRITPIDDSSYLPNF